MAYAQVGANGAVSQGAAGAAVSPAWDAGSPRNAGDLLLCLVGGTESGSSPGAIAGWTEIVIGSGTSTVEAVYWKIAAGADAAPTVPLHAASVWSAMLLEFSGNDTANPPDRGSTNSGGTSPQTATNGAKDIVPGELVIYIGVAQLTGAATVTSSHAPNNGGTSHDSSNDGTSTVDHYNLGWFITTGNASNDSDTYTTTGTISNMGIGIQSFKLPSVVSLRKYPLPWELLPL